MVQILVHMVFVRSKLQGAELTGSHPHQTHVRDSVKDRQVSIAEHGSPIDKIPVTMEDLTTPPGVPVGRV